MKTFLRTHFALIGLALLMPLAQAEDLSTLDELLIKTEIKELVDQYAIARDNIDAVAYANTFTEAGTLIINGQPYTGRAVLQARVAGANQQSIGMHMMSTSEITVIDAQNATGLHYAAVYGAVPGDDHAAGDTIGVAGFVTQGKYYDKYQLTDEGWRIAERRFERVYRIAE